MRTGVDTGLWGCLLERQSIDCCVEVTISSCVLRGDGDGDGSGDGCWLDGDVGLTRLVEASA